LLRKREKEWQHEIKKLAYDVAGIAVALAILYGAYKSFEHQTKHPQINDDSQLIEMVEEE